MAVAILVAACGGSSSSHPGGGEVDPLPCSVQLQSDPGDPIGGGSAFAYSKANSRLTLTVSGGHVSVKVVGDERWTADFVVPAALARPEVGTYSGVGRYPQNDPALAGMAFEGEGRSCGAVNGWFEVDRAVYDGGTLRTLDLRFEQHCDGAGAALHGRIHWNDLDSLEPPGPVQPPPSSLWSPPPGATPTSGPFVYLESDPGDPVGEGRGATYTPADSSIEVSVSGGHLTVGVSGDRTWSGDFEVMDFLNTLSPGLYDGLRRYPIHNPVRGGLDWSTSEHACETVTGWFSIDGDTYLASGLSSIDLRFEQHCDGAGPALRGAIHWEPWVPPPVQPHPVNPPPPGLWVPPPGSTPAAGSYLYLQSDPGDVVGGGRTLLYTKMEDFFWAYTTGLQVVVGVTYPDAWTGTFSTMPGLTQIEPGYYPDVKLFPAGPGTSGGMSWSDGVHACTSVSGWFTVDSLVFSGLSLRALDLRFEQRCNGDGPALHGAIHWDQGHSTEAANPVSPPPDLWRPPPGALPAGINFVYLESDPDDWVGQGGTYLYTQADSVLTAGATPGQVEINVVGDELWTGDFQPPSTLPRLEPGFYFLLEGIPFNDTARGGLDWYGQHRACNTLIGWMAVDDISWAGDQLESIDLRFLQHCDGLAALRGAIHWAQGDPTEPSGPTVPPPAGLWAPRPGSTPAAGSFVYLESEPGDYVGRGVTATYTPANALLLARTSGGRLDVTVDGEEWWTGLFRAPDILPRLEPGYYGILHQDFEHNPARGGLDWHRYTQYCYELQGWFVVDQVTYEGDSLATLDLRFEQQCEFTLPPLHGVIHWEGGSAQAPGPQVPPPADLWAPPPGSTPSVGSYLYLESEPGDWIGDGLSYVYTFADSILTVTAAGGHLHVNVVGDTLWWGDFQVMDVLALIEEGYYPYLRRYTIHDSARGGQDWSIEGRGCNAGIGWVAVDHVAYENGNLAGIDLRFQQACHEGGPALHGALHWDSSEPTQPPGPVNPPPPGLWSPPPAAVPAQGTFVYLQSDPGDPIGLGATYLYTSADQIGVSQSGTTLGVGVSGTPSWFGAFVAMSSLSRIEPGYYGDLHRLPFNNPAKGGMNWVGDGRGCNTLTGWFSVDEITYTDGAITSVDLRFEQHCDGLASALRGQIRWSQ